MRLTPELTLASTRRLQRAVAAAWLAAHHETQNLALFTSHLLKDLHLPS